jgi:voltage-dependent calcium channel
MTIFLILVNGLSALVSIQFLRPDLPADETITFLNLFNAFLGVYQVFSSENWTNVLFGAIEAEIELGQAVIVATYISAWMFFANCESGYVEHIQPLLMKTVIVLQMFIAVINENFDVVEEAKKAKQATSFWAAQQPRDERASWMRHLNPYRWLRANPKALAVEHLPSNLVLPMQQALVEEDTASAHFKPPQKPQGRGIRKYPGRTLDLLQRVFTGQHSQYADIPLTELSAPTRQDPVELGENSKEERLERIREAIVAAQTDIMPNQDVYEVMHERRARKADFIRDHPSYDKTFWIFSQRSRIRQFCQELVHPANGERIFGRQTSTLASTTFYIILLAVVIAGIVVESIATPVYRRRYYQKHGLIRGAWFDIAESTFTLTLVIEFVIKVIADGLFFTPNAYVRSIWNILDAIVLVGISINVTTTLIFIGGLSRITRSLKALRALRLITLLEKMRTTFSDLIISGAIGIFDAALLAILYMIPYAVWGLNIFNGLLNECNDGDVSGRDTCVGEFTSSATGDAFTFLVPRVWDNPAPSTRFSFDSFRSSLLILFEIVSLEGWTDAMGVATSATGRNQQPENNASEANALFFLIYNLMGGVVILTLFVSIIIGNFKAKTGSALQTQPQKEWKDLEKLLRAQKPSRRPKVRPISGVRAWCFDRAVQKHGWWSRSMTFLFFIHFIVLM